MKYDVIGSYKCGCSYGPIAIHERLRYCPKHGEDIRKEYKVPRITKKKKKPPEAE